METKKNIVQEIEQRDFQKAFEESKNLADSKKTSDSKKSAAVDFDFNNNDSVSELRPIPLPDSMKEKIVQKILLAKKDIFARYSFIPSDLKLAFEKEVKSIYPVSVKKEKLSEIHIPLLEQNPFEKFLPPFVEKLKENTPSNIFSLDFGYDLLNLYKTGFAVGANFEQKIFSYASLKTGIQLKREHIPDSRINISSISLGLTGFCYPFGKGLEWLYFGCGIGNDFQTYSGHGNIPSPAEDIVVSILPTVGWKQMFWKMVMLDFFFGYKQIVMNTNRYADNENFVKSGFQYGIKVQIMWARLLKTILHKDIGVDALDKKINGSAKNKKQR